MVLVPAGDRVLRSHLRRLALVLPGADVRGGLLSRLLSLVHLLVLESLSGSNLGRLAILVHEVRQELRTQRHGILVHELITIRTAHGLILLKEDREARIAVETLRAEVLELVAVDNLGLYGHAELAKVVANGVAAQRL